MSGEHEGDRERGLREVARQILLAYPWAAPDHVDAMLRANYDTTDGAKVQNYRLVLAERDTRVQLRHEASARNPRPSASGPTHA